jgi:DNA-binding MarR family transcriptional regulator
MVNPRPKSLDAIDPAQREVAARVGRAWRELRRGASMSALMDYLFGKGDDALESGQMDTLDLLITRDAWRMGDLADGLRVDPSTATRAVQRLERVGLATRAVGADDKRVVMVAATEHGRERHAEAMMRRQTLLCNIMDWYDPAEWETLADFLERFVGALDGFVEQVGDSSKDGAR